MSLVDVWLQPERVVVAVDTRSQVMRTGEFFDASKLLPVPHANTVLTGRGHDVYLTVSLSLVVQSARGTDFEAVEAVMPEVLVHAARFMSSNIKSFGPGAAALEQQEILIAGWSTKQGRGRAVMYKQESFDAGFVASEIAEGWASPWTDAWGAAPSIESLDDLEAMAKDQVRRMRKVDPLAAIGGRLLLADITAAGMSITARAFDQVRTLQSLIIHGG